MKFPKLELKLPERKQKETTPKLPAGEEGAPLAWCVFITGVGVLALLGSTWMLLVFVAASIGHVDWSTNYRASSGSPTLWEWHAEAQIHWILGVGLLLFCISIGLYNSCWIELRRHFRGHFRLGATIIGVAVTLFMISGAIVVQQKGTDARTRDEVVAAQTARAGVASIQAEIDAIEGEMQRLCAPNLTTYQAQACRSGEIAWTARIALAKSQKDWQAQSIERALPDAQQGDRWRAKLTELRKQKAVADVSTVKAEAVTVKAEGWMATFATALEDLRKPIVAVLGEALAMFGFALALGAWRSRRIAREEAALRQSYENQAPWADESHMISEMRNQPKQEPAPMDAGYRGDTVYNGETGEEEAWVEGYVRKKDGKWIPGHYRKTGRKRPIEVEVFEPAATVVGNDAELRASYAPASAIDAPKEAEDAARVMNAILAVTEDPAPEAPVALPNGEGVMLQDEDLPEDLVDALAEMDEVRDEEVKAQEEERV